MVYRNEVILHGTIAEEFAFHHNNGKKTMLSAKVDVERKSKVKDTIVLQIPEWSLKEVSELKKGDEVYICGELKTYSYKGKDGKLHDKNYVYVKNIFGSINMSENNNEVKISGKLVKKGDIRTTAEGKRIIDVTIKTKCNDGHKWAYIPVIFWNALAERVQCFCEVGENISLIGRFQSRNYIKMYADGVKSEKVTYEVSAAKLGL